MGASIRTWRPVNIRLDGKDAAHVLNQTLRETNQRIDSLAAQTQTNLQIRASATLNFGTVNANSGKTAVMNISGVTQGAVVSVSPSLPLSSSHLSWSAYVSGPGQVTVVVTNPTGSNITANTVSWQAIVTL